MFWQFYSHPIFAVLNNNVFWDETPCSLPELNCQFSEPTAYTFRVYGITTSTVVSLTDNAVRPCSCVSTSHMWCRLLFWMPSRLPHLLTYPCSSTCFLITQCPYDLYIWFWSVYFKSGFELDRLGTGVLAGVVSRVCRCGTHKAVSWLKPSNFFRVKKILSTPSFRREVKLCAPCCRFAAC